MNLLSPSKDHGQLLDVIDSLRLQGIDHHVPLPQLIVCGDQSSGKSSVLEAVSGVRFPTKDTLCTRFATELILRRGPSTKADINIRPGQERSDEEKRELKGFRSPTDDIEKLPVMIEAAKDAMGINSQTKLFSEDILRIEVSGPEQYNLTLVDLPGLFHSPSTQQSGEDADLVKSLVRSYMASERSIILAVVAANNEHVNQIVTGFSREVDPLGARTLGIITKPDTLIVGSDMERRVRDLVQNDDVSFRLGWHALRNRDFYTMDHSVEERDRMEMDFFSQGIWTSVPAKFLGIGALKPRLSKVLEKQNISVLPSLVQDIESEIEACQSRLHRLGEARETLQQQRLYLVRVGQTFSSLIKAAIDGVYSPDYFGDAMTPKGYSKRLRAVLQNLLLDFTQDMSLNGQDKVIIDDDVSHKAKLNKSEIFRSAFIDDVLELMKRSRGRELPGTFNPLIVGDLFYKHSKPWKSLVELHSERIIDAIQTALEMAIAAAADIKTCEGLRHELLYPSLDRYSVSLQEKVAEILRPHQQGHPITYNHYFTETVQKAREARERKRQARQLNIFFKKQPDAAPSLISPSTTFNTGDLLDALNRSTEADMDRYACSEAVDCMEAYYKVAMKVLVDNFSVLVVENCVIGDLANCLSPETVMRLDDAVVSSIAAETEDSQIERQRMTDKLSTLQTGMATLNRCNRHQTKGLDDGKFETEISEPANEIVGEDEGEQRHLEERIIPLKNAETRNKPTPNSEKPTMTEKIMEDDSWRNGKFKLSPKYKKSKKAVSADEDDG